ncbi:MAG: TonB-dependent receptor plug domain-containing protein [Gemmatimonadaceae bacterium]
MIRRPTAAPFLFAVATLVARPVFGQGAAQPPKDSLAAVVVTASRVPIATAAPIAMSTVLTGNDLRAQGITRVEDALRLVPGAQVVASGPEGSQTSLFLRGGNSNYVRVLVDGVPVNEAGGAFDWASLTVSNIDRIEVVQGPASVLYGSDAVTGVVQIFTKNGSGPLATNAYVGVGSRGARRDELGWSGGNTSAGFTLSGSHQYTDGILAFNNGFLDDVLSGSLRLNPDSRTDVRVAMRWSSQMYHYPTESDGTVDDHNAEQTDHRMVLSLDAGRKLSDRADFRISLASNEYLPRSNDGPDSPADTLGFYGFYSRSAETRRSGDARVNFRYGARGVFTVGEELAEDREDQTSLSLSQYGSSPGAFNASRHNSATFVQAIGDATDRFSYVVGGRLDQNSAFGTFPTLRASAAYVLSGAARVRASIGSAFTAPSFSENFAAGFVTGNPALQPEHSRSAEVGFDTFLADGRLVLKVTGFLQRFANIIDYSGNAPPGTPSYYNVAAANADGAELGATYKASGGVTLAGSYTYTDTRTTKIGFDSTTGASYVPGQPLIRRPKNAWTVSALQTYASGTQLTLVAVFVGERADRDYVPYPAVPVTLPGYTKVDFSFVQPLPSHIRGGVALEGRVENLFDAHYQEIDHFAAPGRVLFIGVRIGQ